MGEEQLCTHQGQWRSRGRRCSRCWSWDSPAACGADHGETAVPLQPMEVNGGAEIPLQPMEETHAGAGGCLRRGCDPLGSPHWSRVLAGTCRPMERGAHAGGGFLVGLVSPWGTHTGAACPRRTALHGRVTHTD